MMANEAIDSSMLKKLAAMSDEELSAAVKKAAKLLGASESDAERISGNTSLVRAKLCSATDSEIQRALNRVGEDKLRCVAEEIKQEGRRDCNG